MKYIKEYHDYLGARHADRFYWKVPVKYIDIALRKIEIKELKSGESNIKMPDSVIKNIMEDIDKESGNILITYDEGEWQWMYPWQDDGELKNHWFTYMGKVKIDDYEKIGSKYNL
jgi:hypothetical protein